MQWLDRGLKCLGSGTAYIGLVPWLCFGECDRTRTRLRLFIVSLLRLMYGVSTLTGLQCVDSLSRTFVSAAGRWSGGRTSSTSLHASRSEYSQEEPGPRATDLRGLVSASVHVRNTRTRERRDEEGTLCVMLFVCAGHDWAGQFDGVRTRPGLVLVS